tara:strand:- start:14177 stop:14353 length:177 start_codon:yes stop_codon:yes gene_type:complete
MSIADERWISPDPAKAAFRATRGQAIAISRVRDLGGVDEPTADDLRDALVAAGWTLAA